MRTTAMAAMVLLVTAACGDSFSPTTDSVAGSYSATRLETVTAGATTDQLAAGATLSLNLAANGTVTGTLFVPNGDDAGGDLTASMAGTWDLAGNTVTFTQSVDTFVRDMAFTATSDKLIGELTASGATVRVTLTK